MALPAFTYSGVSYSLPAAGTTDFNLTTSGGDPIPFLDVSHIHVYTTTDNGTTLNEISRPAAWDFNTNKTKVVLASGVNGSTSIVIKRITPEDLPYTTYGAGTLLSSDQLNDSTEFNLYIIQEQEDRNAATLLATQASAAAALQQAQAAAASAQAAATDAADAETASNAAIAAANAVTSTANAAASAANAAVQIATQAVAPISPIQVLEPLEILVNAAFSVGRPGTIPFGVGPVLNPGTAFSGISQSDYYPIHHASGSFV